jgi:hypothetical protein
MPLTNAEKQKRWRDRQKQNEDTYREYLRKERERYKSKKERGIVLPISELGTRDQRNKRRQWRRNARNKKVKDVQLRNAIMNQVTPPTSPMSPENNNQRQQQRRQAGRKKVRKDRARAYREIFKLRLALNRAERLTEKYKKRNQRLQKKLPKPKLDPTKETITNRELRKALNFYNVIVQNIKKRYDTTKSPRQRKFISSIVCSYELLRKYRLGQFAKHTLGISKHQMKTGDKTRKKTIKSTRIKKVITEFLERDDNSRLKADKNATVTRYKQKKADPTVDR